MKTRNSQRGVALFMMFFILVLATLAYTIKSLDFGSIKNENDKTTAINLAEAKSALLGYIVLQASKPGTLPCPDTDNNGTANTSGTICTSYIGRLPWKTPLGIPMLKDASNECFWYAVSPIFRNPMSLAQRVASPLNGATTGTITVVDDNNAPIAGVNPVIAVIIAPNNPVGGQTRSGAATLYCPGDSIAAKYLDTKVAVAPAPPIAVNNATGNRPPLAGINYAFKKGSQSASFNDKLIYITADEFFPLLRKRITKEIVGDLDVRSGLVDYYEQPLAAPHNSYPCPASTFNGNGDCSPPIPIVGFVPYSDATIGLQYTALGNWLINNGWFPMTTYSYISATHVTVTVTDPFGSYTCDVNMNVVNCA